MYFFKRLSHDEGHLHANCLFYILTIYLKCLLFKFFTDDIRIHIPILTGVQNGHRSLWKQSYFAKKRPSRGFISEMNATCIPTFITKKNVFFFAKNRFFWGFIFVMKFTCMPSACLIFWLFIINGIVFTSLVVAEVCTFPS